MDSVEAYRQSAAQCLALSRKVGDPADRDLLVTMAQRWLDLADRTDFTDRTKPGDKGTISDGGTSDPSSEAPLQLE
jgi:hypothetical protein